MSYLSHDGMFEGESKKTVGHDLSSHHVLKIQLVTLQRIVHMTSLPLSHNPEKTKKIYMYLFLLQKVRIISFYIIIKREAFRVMAVSIKGKRIKLGQKTGFLFFLSL